jgi:hypothetical protein
MATANHRQAQAQIEQLLRRSLPGARKSVDAHVRRARNAAVLIWKRFQGRPLPVAGQTRPLGAGTWPCASGAVIPIRRLALGGEGHLRTRTRGRLAAAAAWPLAAPHRGCSPAQGYWTASAPPRPSRLKGTLMDHPRSTLPPAVDSGTTWPALVALARLLARQAAREAVNERPHPSNTDRESAPDDAEPLACAPSNLL